MNAFDLFATLALDSSKYEQGLESAKGEAETWGNKFKGIVAKVGTVAFAGMAAKAAVAFTKSAVEAYANYEQLAGGVETLFKDSADTVQEYANNAYKTAGLSANEYMETVTSFSASLLQSLGGDTQKAAEMADMAIIDMSDNANKMGTDMASIQHAYQGFAKQNFTMLDNLKLGYGGTKEEMERLLRDATAISGIKYDVSSYADIVSAIHVIQEEMGIAGTTAKEASETISGSLASLKSAWQNLVAGFANENADIDKLINNVVEAGKTALDNLVPAVKRALQGIATALPQVVQMILEMLPEFVDTAGDIILALANGLSKSLPDLLPAIVDVITNIVAGLMNNIDKIVVAAAEIIVALAIGLVKAIPKLVVAVPKIIEGMVKSLLEGSPEMAEAVNQIMTMIAEGIQELIDSALQWGSDLLDNFIQGIKDKMSSLVDTVKGVASKVKQYLGFSEPELGPLSNFHTYAPDMMKLFAEGITNNQGLISDAISDAFDLSGQVNTAEIQRPSNYSGMDSGYIQQQRVAVDVNFTGSLSELARLLKPYITAETTRVGPSLTIVGGTHANY